MAEFIPNTEAEAIATDIIDQFHPWLVGVKIAHLSKIKPKPAKPRKAPRSGKRITMAKASKVSDKMQALAAQDIKFVIEYDGNIWKDLTLKQQCALVDHELSHCGVDGDGYFMKNHDLEEFRAIVTRHGFWKDDIRQFAETTEVAFHADEESVRVDSKV